MTVDQRKADLGRGLRWVRGELDQSLERIRVLLAGVLDDEQPLRLLSEAVGLLRQMGNICAVARCTGGQLLAMQMAQSMEQAHKAEQRQDDLLAELVASSYQLGKYLGVVVDGIPDHPLALLSVVNGLREVGGQKHLGAPAALAQIWNAGHQLPLPPAGPNRGAAQLTGLAAKHFPVLNQAFARISQDRAHMKAWQILGQAAGQFTQVAPSATEWGLWQVFRGIAVVGPRLPEGAAPRIQELLKHTLAWVGNAGRLTPAAREANASTLLAGWVLLVVQLDRKGSLAESLLTPVHLSRDELLGQRLRVIEDAMQRPAEDSLVAVLRALQQDFVALRDEIEVLQADSNRSADAVDAVVRRCKLLSATVRGLGDDALAEKLHVLGRQVDALADMPPDAPGWAELAEGLIRVEQEIGAALLGSRHRAEAKATSPMAAEARASILRECLISLARVKTEVEAFCKSQRGDHLLHAADHLRELTGALKVFGDDRLTTPMVGLRAILTAPEFGSAMDSTAMVAAMADAIASAEYLLEALRDGDPDAGAEADRFQDFVELLAKHTRGEIQVAEPAAVEPAEQAAPEVIDDDLREIFLEEAAEVLSTLQEEIEPWMNGQSGAQDELRRAFHTLKGSGRMVGATDIGEFGWAFESLLNRCDDGALERSKELVTLVGDGVAALEEIVKRFGAGDSAAELVGPLCARANQLLGRAESPAEDLRATFLADAEPLYESLKAVDVRQPPEQAEITAWHTLRGSAAAIDANALSGLCAAAEHFCNQAGLAQKLWPTGLHDQTLTVVLGALARVREGGDADADMAADLGAQLRSLANDLLETSGGMDEDDAELRMIFCAEAQELLENADDKLAELQAGTSDPQAMHELGRAFHTLKGSAKMAGAQGLGKLGTLLDTQAKQVLTSGGVPAQEALKLFAAGNKVAWSLLDAFQAGRDEASPDLAGLRAMAAGEVAIPVQPEADEATPASPAAEADAPAPAADVEAARPSAEAPAEDFGESSLAAEAAPEWSEPTAPVEEPADIETPAEAVEEDQAPAEPWVMDSSIEPAEAMEHTAPEAVDMDSSQPAEVPPAVAAPPVATVSTSVIEDDVDPELLEIFLPECDELLEEIDGALAGFNRARPGDGLAALFRALHTLKGGARMAGLLQLGESAHDLETLVERLRGAGRPVEAAEQAQIQSAADGLRALREAAEAPLPGPSAAPAASESASSSIEGIPLIEGDADGMEWATETVHDTGADVVSRAGDTTRVQVSHLDGMLAEVGEISMFRSRLEQQLVGLGGQLREFDQTIERLRSQVRNLEVATDAQIQARASGQRQAQEEGDRYEAEFDPLEMDRYTRMQELTRSITETISDLGSLHRGMREAVGESEAMVLQQGRLSTSMQEGLLTTLALPFSRQQNRLARVVRQAASENGKQAKLQLSGGETEMDRNVLERIVPALEHVLRNAIIHGIESPEVRTGAGKSPEGTVQILLQRESNRIVVEVRDDGGGLNHERIREVAVRRGLLAADAELSFDRIAQFIFEPGFSTAEGVSLAAGRGVGMDAVAAEVRQLGGSIDVASERGKGCRFLIRLPFSLAITQALQVRVADDDFIVPLPTISGVARMPAADIQAAMESDPHLDYGGVRYEVHALAQALGRAERGTEAGGYVPVLFVRTGADSGRGRNFAVVVDHLLGTREVVAKNVGRQLATVPGVAGASIQPDGRVVLILDLADLILDRERRGLRSESSEAVSAQKLAPLVMVIDDSITMRRVAERVLTRAGYRVALAKDGADGVAQLQTTRPDAVLLDIEMPRMDGFEVAGFMRHDDSLRDVPIVMITSRSGDKHRTRAADLGVNGYLVKPYQEQQLLAEVELQLREPQQLQVQA